MNSSAWKEKRVLLASAFGFLLLNAIFFVTYRIRYQERIDDLHQKFAAAKVNLEAAHGGRAAAERNLAVYKKTLQTTETVYESLWSTPEQRLTALITEVHRLSEKSGLNPAGFNYESTQKSEAATTSMGIAFDVEGTYAQVRNLTNLLELSRQFLIIDRIGLSDSSGASGGSLRLTIHIRTLFRDRSRGAASTS